MTHSDVTNRPPLHLATLRTGAICAGFMPGRATDDLPGFLADSNTCPACRTIATDANQADKLARVLDGSYFDNQ